MWQLYTCIDNTWKRTEPDWPLKYTRQKLRLIPLLDTYSQTSLNTSPQRNPRRHYEVHLTSSGRWKFISTDPQRLDFDWGSKSTQYVRFKLIHRPQCNTTVTSQEIAVNLPPPHTTLVYDIGADTFCVFFLIYIFFNSPSIHTGL